MNLAAHTVAVTEAIFSSKKAQPVNLNAAETLALAKKLEKSIYELMKTHNDVFGNLGHSMELISDIITNLEGHQIEIGCGVK